MTSWAVPIEGRDVWSGPTWAAPEVLERWMFRPAPRSGTLGAADHVIIRALKDGHINAHQFQQAWQLSLKSRAETADWTEEDWARWEQENPE